MATNTSARTTRLLALLLSALMTASLVVAQQSAAHAGIAFPNTERIEGESAIDIAIAVSERIFGDGAAGAAVIARDDTFPDALAASSVASVYDGPLLFTPTTRLDTRVRDELARVLDPGGRVWVMGGPNAISPTVFQELENLGYDPERIEGVTRIETAAAATDRVMAELSRQGRTQTTAMVVRSAANDGDDLIRGWVDSVTCGGLAADNDYPVLLTNPGTENLHVSTRNRIDLYDFSRVLICGGPSAVPIEHQAEISAMGVATVRASGPARTETAVDVAQRSGFWGQTDPDQKVYILVPGWDQDFAYGLAAAQLSNAFNAPLLLVSENEPDTCEGNDRSRATLCYLQRVGDGQIAGLVAVGSTSIISDATFADAARAGGLEEDTTPPAVPTGVSTADTAEDDGTQVDVAWNPVDDGQNTVLYNVYFKATDETTLTKSNGTKANEEPVGSAALTVDGLTAGTSYDFAVASIDRFGNESALSDVSSETPTDEAPSTPASAPTLGQVEGGVQISWLEAPEADAVGYRLQRGVEGTLQGCDDTTFGASYEDLEDENGEPVFVTPKTELSYVDPTVEVGESYCYRYFVEDSSGNPSGTSPEAGPIEVEATPPPSAPPAAAPRLAAVNFDNAPGTVASPNGASRISAAERSGFRVDVIVPKGAYAEGATGVARVKADDSTVGQRTFTAPATAATADFVVSVTAAMPSAVGARNLRAVLVNGPDEGPASASWPVELADSQLVQPRPVLTVVNRVEVDPRQRPDQLPLQDVGSAAEPQVDPTPLLLIENVPTDADWFLQVWNNGVMRYERCFPLRRDGQVVLNGAAGGAEDPAFDQIFEGLNNLTVSVLDANTTCADPVFNGPVSGSRSGDSNSVRYFLERNATGIVSTTPSFGDVDPFGELFEVQFNQTVAQAAFTLRRLEPLDVDPLPANQSTGTVMNTDRLSLSFPGASALASKPGLYLMEITFTPAGGAQRHASVRFHVGVTHAFGVSAARGVDPDTSPGEPVIVFNGDAPTGYVETAYAADPTCDVTSTDHITNEEDQAAGKAEANFVRGVPERISTRPGTPAQTQSTLCYRYTRVLDATTDPVTTEKVSVWQPDGTIPAPPGPSDLAVRVKGVQGPGFQTVLTSSGNWPSGDTHDLWYGPADDGDATYDWHRPPVLARSAATGSVSDIAATEVATGWWVRYFLVSPQGNESAAATDGRFQSVSAIQPQNGLSSSPGVLSSSDALIVDLAAPVSAPDGGAIQPATSDGSMEIIVGEGPNAAKVDPRFGVAGGSSVSTSTFDNGSKGRLTITFGSATRLGGQATPAAATPPTSLHGGPAVRGLSWLVFTGTGHAVLLPAAPGVRNLASTF